MSAAKREIHVNVCFVLTREHSDRSAYEVLRVFTSEARAKLDLMLIEGDFGMTYKIHPVMMIAGDAT